MKRLPISSASGSPAIDGAASISEDFRRRKLTTKNAWRPLSETLEFHHIELAHKPISRNDAVPAERGWAARANALWR
jgi:hypothetical protein